MSETKLANKSVTSETGSEKLNLSTYWSSDSNSFKNRKPLTSTPLGMEYVEHLSLREDANRNSLKRNDDNHSVDTLRNFKQTQNETPCITVSIVNVFISLILLKIEMQSL